MKKLQLDTVYSGRIQVPDGLKHHLPGFTGKSQDYMNNDFQSCLPQPPDSIVKTRKGVTPANHRGGLFMNRLQSQLYANRLVTVQFLKEPDHLIRQAVRPGGNIDYGHIRMIHSLHIFFTKL